MNKKKLIVLCVLALLLVGLIAGLVVHDRMEKAEQEQSSPAPVQPAAAQQPVPMAYNSPAGDEDAEDHDPAEIRKFVICPNCGEKIWL